MAMLTATLHRLASQRCIMKELLAKLDSAAGNEEAKRNELREARRHVKAIEAELSACISVTDEAGNALEAAGYFSPHNALANHPLVCEAFTHRQGQASGLHDVDTGSIEG